jgi:hypothetical protein
MPFLLSHWHCILPALGIIAALFFMREKPKENKNVHDEKAEENQ